MYDFRSKTRPAAHPSRFHQRRLIYLVGGLALVLYAMWQAKDPKNWRWVETLTQPRVVDVDTAAPARPPGTKPQDDDLPGPMIVPDRRQTEKPDASKPLAERVNKELLRNVIDNVVGQDPRETDALYHLMEILAGAEPDAIRAAGAEPVTHLQLWEQSDAYRGKLVSMRGEIRLVRPRTLSRNDYGLSTYYEVWMQPAGTSNPVMIWALELPADFPIGGDELNEPATVIGFYYRRWGYTAGDAKRPETVKDRVAPMILARGVDWSPRATADGRAGSGQFEMIWWIGAIVVTVAVVGMLLMRRYSRGQPPDYIQPRLKQGDLTDVPGDAGPRDAAAELRRLSQADEPSQTNHEPERPA